MSLSYSLSLSIHPLKHVTFTVSHFLSHVTLIFTSNVTFPFSVTFTTRHFQNISLSSLSCHFHSHFQSLHKFKIMSLLYHHGHLPISLSLSPYHFHCMSLSLPKSLSEHITLISHVTFTSFVTFTTNIFRACHFHLSHVTFTLHVTHYSCHFQNKSLSLLISPSLPMSLSEHYTFTLHITITTHVTFRTYHFHLSHHFHKTYHWKNMSHSSLSPLSLCLSLRTSLSFLTSLSFHKSLLHFPCPFPNMSLSSLSRHNYYQCHSRSPSHSLTSLSRYPRHFQNMSLSQNSSHF